MQKFCARIAAPWDLFIAHSEWAQHYVNVNVSINYPANTMNLAGFCDGAFHIFKKSQTSEYCRSIALPLPTDIGKPKRSPQRERERENKKKEGQIKR